MPPRGPPEPSARKRPAHRQRRPAETGETDRSTRAPVPAATLRIERQAGDDDQVEPPRIPSPPARRPARGCRTGRTPSRRSSRGGRRPVRRPRPCGGSRARRRRQGTVHGSSRCRPPPGPPNTRRSGCLPRGEKRSGNVPARGGSSVRAPGPVPRSGNAFARAGGEAPSSRRRSSEILSNQELREEAGTANKGRTRHDSPGPIEVAVYRNNDHSLFVAEQGNLLFLPPGSMSSAGARQRRGKAPALCRVGSRVEPGSHQVGSRYWRLQASPRKGHAHRRQGGIPFSLCWL